MNLLIECLTRSAPLIDARAPEVPRCPIRSPSDPHDTVHFDRAEPVLLPSIPPNLRVGGTVHDLGVNASALGSTVLPTIRIHLKKMETRSY